MESAMMEVGAVQEQRVQGLGTSLGRARCPQPCQVERMRGSLTKHGQLTPVVTVRRGPTLEIVDGFKRRAAAESMGWVTLRATVVSLDERSQWAAMLTLNRGPGSMSVLEEALVLKEMLAVGLSQTEIGEMLGKHKTWVCRRVGLVERLHTELIEAVRLGLLDPGVARRLLSLPPGNQLQLAAVVQQAALGARDTELLVKLWREAAPEMRQYLLSHPRESLEHAKGAPEKPVDVRLTPRGQKLQRLLRVLQEVLPRTAASMEPPPRKEDMVLLSVDLGAVRALMPLTMASLGPGESCGCNGKSDASDATL